MVIFAWCFLGFLALMGDAAFMDTRSEYTQRAVATILAGLFVLGFGLAVFGGAVWALGTIIQSLL